MDERLIAKLSQMRDDARMALIFIEGMTKAEFVADARTRDACCMKLIVVGETTRRVIEGWPRFIADHGDIAWKSMTGMRNRIAHGYEDIDFEIVWDTLRIALPPLIAKLDDILT